MKRIAASLAALVLAACSNGESTGVSGVDTSGLVPSGLPTEEQFETYFSTVYADTSRASCLRYADELTLDDVVYCRGAFDEDGPLESTSPVDYRNNLVIALAHETEPVAIIARFAALSERPAGEAALIARLMLLAERAVVSCREREIWRDCVPADQVGFNALFEETLAIDHDGALWNEIDRSFDMGNLLLPVIDRVELTPRHRNELVDDYNYTHDFRLLVLATHDGEIDPRILQSALTRPPREASPIDRLAYLDALKSRMPTAAGESALLLDLLRIRTALDLGLSDRALNHYQRLVDSHADSIWDRAAQSHISPSESQRSREQLHRLAIDLAAASLRSGDRDGTSRLLALAEQIAEFTDEDDRIAEAAASTEVYPNRRNRISLFSHAVKSDFLQEYMSRNLPEDEVYNLFITGSPGPGLPSPDPDLHLRSSMGWLWVMRGATTDARALASAYLRDRNQPDLADYLESRAFRHHEPDIAPLELNWTAFRDARERITDAVATESNADAPQRTAPPRLDVFQETPLPDSVAASSLYARPEMAGPDIEWPFPAASLVRWDQEGSWVRAIYLSTELDPAGEVSGGGYWFIDSQDGGRSWRAPLYLGLQQFFPYVILGQSSLPLVDQGRLQIEVAVREIDPDSITFPPIALRALREEDGLYIHARLDDLRHDSDSDGLTDIFEHRVGLDMTLADSDGDGIDDGRDPMPLTTFQPVDPAMNELALCLLPLITRLEQDAIRVPILPDSASLDELLSVMDARPPAGTLSQETLILEAPQNLFAGLVSDLRILVYDTETRARISPDYGRFYPVGIPAILRNEDASQVYVIWNAGWTGGEVYLRREDDGDYAVFEILRWIT